MYILGNIVYDNWGWIAKVNNNKLIFNVDRELDNDYKKLIFDFVYSYIK